MPVVARPGRTRPGRCCSELKKAGLDTREAVLYRQLLLPLSDEARKHLQRGNPVIIPLFSPRTAKQFSVQFSGRAPLFVAAMSEAVAQPVAHLPLQQLRVAERPDAMSMMAVTKGLLDAVSAG